MILGAGILGGGTLGGVLCRSSVMPLILAISPFTTQNEISQSSTNFTSTCTLGNKVLGFPCVKVEPLVLSLSISSFDVQNNSFSDSLTLSISPFSTKNDLSDGLTLSISPFSTKNDLSDGLTLSISPFAVQYGISQSSTNFTSTCTLGNKVLGSSCVKLEPLVLTLAIDGFAFYDQQTYCAGMELSSSFFEGRQRLSKEMLVVLIGLAWNFEDKTAKTHQSKWAFSKPKSSAKDNLWGNGETLNQQNLIIWGHSDQTHNSQFIKFNFSDKTSNSNIIPFSFSDKINQSYLIDWGYSQKLTQYQEITYTFSQKINNYFILDWQYTEKLSAAFIATWEYSDIIPSPRYANWGWGAWIVPTSCRYAYFLPTKWEYAHYIPSRLPRSLLGRIAIGGPRFAFNGGGNSPLNPWKTGGGWPYPPTDGSSHFVSPWHYILMSVSTNYGHFETGEIVWENLPVAFISVFISVDIDSFATLSGTMLDVPFGVGDVIQITAFSDNIDFVFIVDSIQRSEKFTEKRFTVTALAKMAETPIENYQNTTNLYAQNIAAANKPNGWSLDWETKDWIIPAKVATFTRKTSLQIIAALAIGGAVQCDIKTKTIRVFKRWPLPPWKINNDTYWDAVSKYELATSKIISISSSFIPGEKYNKAIVTGYVIGVGIKDGTNGDYCAPPEENAYLADDESVYDACEDILAKNYPAYKHQVTIKSDDYLAPGSLLEIPLLGLRGIIVANTIKIDFTLTQTIDFMTYV